MGWDWKRFLRYFFEVSFDPCKEATGSCHGFMIPLQKTRVLGWVLRSKAICSFLMLKDRSDDSMTSLTRDSLTIPTTPNPNRYLLLHPSISSCEARSMVLIRYSTQIQRLCQR